MTAPPAELESLFRENHDLIYRTAYRLTGSKVDAEDVLQTVFLRLARREEKVSFNPSPAAYLHRAAVNAALDLLRHRGRARAVPLVEAEIVFSQSRANNPEAQHADRELRALVRAAIARLGGRAAEMFALRYLEGYDNREIAALLGTSQMVVAVTLHRSRSRLRQEIGRFLEQHHEAN
jgi:RNA polymerase sigma-70 factor (ECF subfamily)